ncbi:MAG: CHAT domain-containing protein [bacterium]
MPPIKILVMISSPENYPQLAVTEEWLKLKQTLRILENQKYVTLERLEKATLGDLQDHLGRNDYHVFHFIGHGGFDQYTREGGLVMEDDRRQAHLVGGKLLGALLHDEHTLRLAVLNACEGARGTRQDLFAGPAQSLMQQGIPAVLAMQFEIRDEVAITFAHEFYSALVRGQSIEAALAETRKKIFFHGHELEWAAPVLYLRAPDGRIFNVKSPAKALNPKGATDHHVIINRMYFAHIRLSLLFYLNDFSEASPGVNITTLCRALSVKKRKFAVLALKKLANEGLIEKSKTGKSVNWAISQTGREALRTLAGWIDTRILLPQGRH